MNIVLDHVFILVGPGGAVADLLVELGLEEGLGREHKGQGTANRRFEFSNGMLEFLWVRDFDEATKGPARGLLLAERGENINASPFGMIFHRKDNDDLGVPFDGWEYQPDYFAPPMAFHVGLNSSALVEPLCVYVPFIEPYERNLEEGTFRSISQVDVYIASAKQSDILDVCHKADGLAIHHSDEHRMEIVFDNNQSGCSKDFRPEIPLIIHW